MPTVKSNHQFRVKRACPYCGADLHATARAWEQHDGGEWKATEIEVECSHVPDPYDHVKWRRFMQEHTVEVYERWHPLVEKILTQIQLEYSFDLENDSSIVH